MSFADNAIGFYLQMEDQMSPTVVKAGGVYNRFVKSLEKANKTAYKTASQGFAALGQVVEQFAGLANGATAANKVTAALSQAAKKASKGKPTKVEMVITPRVKTDLAKVIANGVSLALSKATSLMTAQGEGFVSSFKVHRFAKGGIVPGTGNKDSVPAMLTPGEAVIPKDAVKSVRMQMMNLEKLAESIKELQAVHAAGIDPKSGKALNEVLAKADIQFKKLQASATGLGSAMQKKFAPGIVDLHESLKAFHDDIAKSPTLLQRFSKSLERAMGPMKFLAIMKAMEKVASGFRQLRSDTAELYDNLGKGDVDNYTDALNEIGNAWGYDRKQLYALRTGVITSSNAMTSFGSISSTALGAASNAMWEAGVASDDLLKRLAPLQAIAAKGGMSGLAEDISVMSQALNLSDKQIASNMQSFIGLKQKTSLATGTIDEFAASLTAAAQGDGEAMEQLQKSLSFSGMSADMAVAAYKMGDAQAANEAFVQSLGEIARMGPAAGAQLKALGLSVKPSEIASFANGYEDTVKAMRDGRQTFLDAGGDVRALNDAVSKGDSAWKKFRDGIGNFLNKNASWLVDFFNDFNPIMVFAVMQLGKIAFNATVATTALITKLFPALGGLMVKVGTWAAGLFTFNAAVAATGPAAAASGAGAAGGMASFGAALTTIGAGLTALVPAIPVILTLSVAAVALGAALWLAAPAIKEIGIALVELGKVLVGGIIEGMKALLSFAVTMVQTLLTVNPAQVAALGLSLPFLGAGLIAFGAGLLAFSVSAAASSVGLAMLAGAMALFGTPSGASIGGVLSNLFAAFNFDPAVVTNALRGIQAAGAFLMQFAAVSALMAGMGAASLLSGAVDSILGFFGIGSPGDKLSKQGTTVANTINGVTASLMGIDTANAGAVQGKLAYAARLVQSLRGYDGLVDAADLKAVGNPVLEHRFAVTPPTVDEIKATVAANIETRQMVGLMTEQNDILRQILAAQTDKISPTRVTAPTRNAQRYGASPLSNAIANGRA